MRTDNATAQLETVNANAEKISDLAISSQAPQECGEGSTTRPRSPERTVKAHEHAGSVRICPICGDTKELYGGIMGCKRCRKARSLEYYQTHRAKISARHVIYSREMSHKKRKIASEWAKNNRHKRAAIWAAYYTSKMNAMPKWADRDAIENVYESARRRTLNTGVPHHVDHIVPLQGETVCGLHVHWNLQVITAFQNASKKNRLTEQDVV